MASFRTRLTLVGSAAALAAGALAPARVVGAQPAAAAGFEWVALGDYCTAGVIPAAGDTFEVPRDGCERTDQSCRRPGCWRAGPSHGDGRASGRTRGRP